jgi:hypothetical protein
MTVWIYVNTSKQVGDKDHLKVFANEDAAETWLQENDSEGVAFLIRCSGVNRVGASLSAMLRITLAVCWAPHAAC